MSVTLARALMHAQNGYGCLGGIHRGRSAAQSFAEAATAFLELVESLDAAQWQAPSLEDGRPIGTITHHVALGHAIIVPAHHGDSLVNHCGERRIAANHN